MAPECFDHWFTWAGKVNVFAAVLLYCHIHFILFYIIIIIIIIVTTASHITRLDCWQLQHPIVATGSTHFPSVHVVCISKTTPFAWQSVFAYAARYVRLTHAPVVLRWTLSVNMLCRAGNTLAGYSVMLRSTT